MSVVCSKAENTQLRPMWTPEYQERERSDAVIHIHPFLCFLDNPSSSRRAIGYFPKGDFFEVNFIFSSSVTILPSNVFNQLCCPGLNFIQM
ncbi:hypothetical protein M8J75_005390 [Diaphorina citri]|nr:hypothetical protein M8J75_005390 [Diaphorina citri]